MEYLLLGTAVARNVTHQLDYDSCSEIYCGNIGKKLGSVGL
jgi:hypothetical protein